jgi:hypothetical protein
MIFPFLNGGLSYDPATVERLTQTNMVWILLACTLSFIGAYIQYFGAIKMGFKDRTHSIPLLGNLWFFAHDTTYVMNFHHWFFGTEFWLLKPFWAALLVFACCETVVTYQILRFSREELFPGLSKIGAVLSYVGLQLFAYGLFWWFLSMIRDPFYLLCFATTVVMAPMFNIAMMRKRGSRRGFSLFMLSGFIPLTVGFWAWMFLIDPYFRQPFLILVALGNVGMAIAGMLEYRHQPPYQLDMLVTTKPKQGEVGSTAA